MYCQQQLKMLPRINFSIPCRIIMHAKYLVFSRLCMKITVYLYWNLTRNVDLHNVSVVFIRLKAYKSTLSCEVFYQIHTSYSNCNLLSSYFHTTTISNQKDQLPWETNHWLNFFFSHFWQFSNIVPDNRSRKKNSTILCKQLQLMICKIDTIVAIYMCSYFNLRNVFFDMIFLNLSKNSIFAEIYIIK